MRLINSNNNPIEVKEFIDTWSNEYSKLNISSYPDDIYNYFLVKEKDTISREKMIWMGAWKWNMISLKDNPTSINVLDKYKFKPGWAKGTKKEHHLYNNIDLDLLKKIKELKSSGSSAPTQLKDYFEKVSNIPRMGMVNAVFMLHIVNCEQYPIYDQFVHRSYDYIYGGASLEFFKNKPLSNLPAYKHIYEYLCGYRRLYFDFVDLIDKSGLPNEEKPSYKRKVDKALWVFGRWLRKS